MLIAALEPPVKRTLLLAEIEEIARYNDQNYPLYCNHYTSGAVDPAGYKHIERFRLESAIPEWTFAFAGSILTKRIWMPTGENKTYIQYQYSRSPGLPIQLEIRILVNYRDHHKLTHANQSAPLVVRVLDHCISIQSSDYPEPFFIHYSSGQFYPSNQWVYNFYLAMEDQRGQDAVEDHWLAGVLTLDLTPGEKTCLVASTNQSPPLNCHTALQQRKYYENQIFKQAKELHNNKLVDRAAIRQLVLAADQFIVKRTIQSDPNGHSILAGYPWFSDWGRDTMMSLPGLTLATGRPEIARSILLTYADYVDQGMLPNRFPDAGQQPEYNTFDATLWYFEAIRAYLEATQDADLLRKLFPVLEHIIDYHLKGTRFNIHCDPSDGLLFGGNPGSQLTWMDVRIDGWAVTPRNGKPVEINALWFNAIRFMAESSLLLKIDPSKYSELAETIRDGFQRYWNPTKQYLYDVLDGPDGNDASLRPNQLLAVSLNNQLLTKEQAKSVVDICALHLLTSYGLRSLAPYEAGYLGYYGGSRWQRDTAYHQGTVWGWLIGPFIRAHLKVYQDPRAAFSYLHPMIMQLKDHGLGSISEIFDGNAPHLPNGCIAQAWSVAEVLLTLAEIERLANASKSI